MDEGWPRVGKAVRDRRMDLGRTQRECATAAGVSEMTWFNLEAGKSVKARTSRKASEALGWTPDSIDRILAGKNPLDNDAEALIDSIARHPITLTAPKVSEQELAAIFSMIVAAMETPQGAMTLRSRFGSIEERLAAIEQHIGLEHHEPDERPLTEQEKLEADEAVEAL